MNTDFKTTTGTSTIPDLPVISKYFGDDAMQKGKEMFSRWRKGERPIGAVIALILMGVATWGIFKWVLPMLFAAIGAWVAVAAPIALTLLAIMMRKPIYKFFRRITRAFHMALIRWKPFDEFYDQISKMRKNLESYLGFKAVIKKLRNQFETTAQKERDEAEQSKGEFSDYKSKAERIKKQMDDMLSKDPNCKDTDEYSEFEQQLMNAVSAANRASSTVDKSSEWAMKYAARANVFAKLERRLGNGTTRIENMIKDFEKQVELWQKDYDGARSSRNATNILKQMLGGNHDNWELDYAIDFVTNQIAEDYAVTAQNIEDLNRLTSDFDFNSDDAYAKLDALAEKINTKTIPDVDKISNVGHKLTKEEKTAAGNGLGDITF